MATGDSLPDWHPLARLQRFAKVDPACDSSREAYRKFLEGKSASELSWWSNDTVAVVTGANKGIGFEIVRQLATVGITTILTARDESRGLAAVSTLKAEGLENVIFHSLDVTKPDSAASLASWLKEKFGGLDILVANAGVGSLDLNYEVAKYIVDTNYYGQKIVTSVLLPLFRPSPAGARILYITSELAQIQLLRSEKLKQQLYDIDRLTEEDVDALANKYLEDVKSGQLEEWTNEFVPMYNESKMLLNAYARLLAKSLSGRLEGNKVYVNMMTPGFTGTEMNGYPAGSRTVKEGVDTAVWALLLPSGGPTGAFLRDRADYPF